MTWLGIGILAAGAYCAKAAGLLFGARLGAFRRVDPLLALLPGAVLAALVVVQTFDGGRRLVVDARLPGVLIGSIAAWRRAPFVVVVAAAAAVTALVRLI